MMVRMAPTSQDFADAFPRAAQYRSSPSPTTGMRETPASFQAFPFFERHIQCLWADGRQRPERLATLSGEPVEVVHPGRWNLEKGPDFLRAELVVGQEKRRMRGDLEIHIHPNGWHRHGHAGDSNFANVLFHVVHFPGPDIPGLIQIPLQPILENNPGFSYENIDTTAYPYAKPGTTHPLAGLSPARRTDWLESVGEARLRRKTERYADILKTTGAEQLLWEELLAALGYKTNSGTARRLAKTLPVMQLKTEYPDTVYAILLGTAGLLPKQHRSAWPTETRHFIRRCWDVWWRQPEEQTKKALAKEDWQLAGIRPANHPQRRLMAATFYAGRGLCILDHPAQLTDFPETFWTRHFTWSSPCPPTGLVGQPRASAIGTNVIAPLRTALGKPPQLDTLKPEPLNSPISQTAFALFGGDHTPGTYRSALARQGLIQIFHDYLICNRLDELVVE